MATPAAVPYDILDDVFYAIFQAGDSTSMKRCRLANKALARIGRKHIFHTIRLKQREGFGHTPHPMGKFLEFVRGSPSITGYIRVLEVLSDETYNNPGPFEFLRLVNLTRLESLSITFGHDDFECQRTWLFNIAPDICSSIEVVLRGNPRITSLHMMGMDRIPIDLLLHVPLLQNLSMWKVSPRREDSQKPGMPSMRLRALHLRDGCVDFLQYVGGGADYLIDILEVTDLELDVDTACIEQRRRIPGLLTIPRQLESFKICAIVYGITQETHWASGGKILASVLSSSTNVRTLRKITTNIKISNASDWDPYVGLLPELIRIQGRNALEEISLYVSCGWNANLSKDPAVWHELDRVLSSGFSHLRRLHLEFDVPEEGGDVLVMDLLEAQLPWCHANLQLTSYVEVVLI